MSRLYQKANDRVLSRVRQVMERYHSRLLEPTIIRNVSVETILVYGPRNKDGIQTAPAIMVRGIEAYACIRCTKLEERVAGRQDAVMWIDGDNCSKWPPPTFDAIIDHELTHIELQLDPKKGEIQFDDAERVKIKMRAHDFEVGWFDEVADRHKQQSIEVMQARTLLRDVRGQYYFPDFDIAERQKKKRA